MVYKYQRREAKRVFDHLEQGILRIIEAADIYALHLIAKYRQKEPEYEVIQHILSRKRLSGFTVTRWLYKDDLCQFLEKEDRLRSIGQQIVLSTYTALERYLIEKFCEYYRYVLREQANHIVENSLKRFSFRSLEEIKRHYYDILQIHLPSFEFNDFEVDSQTSFYPRSSWEAILLIASTRHDVAHQGVSEAYKIVTLVDSWLPFSFSRRWVAHFDVNFDFLIYGGRETGLIKAYRARVAKMK